MTVAVLAGAATASASPDDVTPMNEQPARSAPDAARVAAAEQALLRTSAIARSAKTVKEACSGIGALRTAFAALKQVQAPAGLERPFTDGRNELLSDVEFLRDPMCAHTGVEDVRRFLGRRMRAELTKWQRIGKPPSETTYDTPEARARSVLRTQLAALDRDDDFGGTFVPGAIVLTPAGTMDAHAPDGGAGGQIADLNPHAEVDSASYDHFASGAVGPLIWFAADVHITVTSHEPENPPSTDSLSRRAIELLDGNAGWKVAAAAFTNVGNMHLDGRFSEISEPTAAGPLTRLLLSPPALAAALADNAVVYGTDPGERGASGKEARALLAKWKKLAITLDTPAQVREVRGATYGYAMANVNVTTKPGGLAYRLDAFVIAVPAADGKWSVIAASYGAL
jgi:hypothetical protein